MKNENGYSAEDDKVHWIVTRREFLRGSGLVIAGLTSGMSLARADEKTDGRVKLSFGIVTDAHYADAPPRGKRQYRESVAKMTECVTLMNEQKVDFLIELGDFKDQGKPVKEEATLEYLTTIEGVYRQFNGPRYHVLGNHDMDSISKEQFLSRVENTGIAKNATYYSFDTKGCHLVVLDANYKSDGSDYDHGKFNWTDANVSSAQLDWLKKDLASAAKPTVVFVHQQLDVKGNTGIKNAEEVRQVLQDSKNVLAVFQGHHHPGHYTLLERIHYYTLKAVVEGAGAENNSYAIVTVHDDNSIVVTGYHRAVSTTLEKA